MLLAALLVRDSDAEKYNARIAELERELGQAQGRLVSFDRERSTMRTVLMLILAVAASAVIVLVVVLVLNRPA